MKTALVTLVAVLALAVIGCGPSAEQKKMLSDLTSEVTTMINDTKSSLGELDGVGSQLTSALASGDSLKMKFPKDSTAVQAALTQLNAAKARVMGVKDNVEAWINSYKAPDLANMKFDNVIADLKKAKDDLSEAKTEVQGAMSAASTALENYNNMFTNMMSKAVAKRK